MTTRIGTAHFVSIDAARRYYAKQGDDLTEVKEKLAEGTISIGKPDHKPTEWLSLIDDGTRYAINEGTMTRKEYMEDSSARHHAYYLQVALEIGLTPHILPATIERIREALKTDEHLNNIPLAQWDARVPSLRGATAALKARGDYLSLGTGVCILKAYAKHLATQAAG